MTDAEKSLISVAKEVAESKHARNMDKLGSTYTALTHWTSVFAEDVHKHQARTGIALSYRIVESTNGVVLYAEQKPEAST